MRKNLKLSYTYQHFGLYATEKGPVSHWLHRLTIAGIRIIHLMCKILASYPYPDRPTSRIPTLRTLRSRFCNITNCYKKMLRGFWKTWKMLQSQCCKDFGTFKNVAKLMLQEFWKFLQHFFPNVATKKNLWVQLNGRHIFLEGYPQLHWHVYQNKTGTSTDNSWW